MNTATIIILIIVSIIALIFVSWFISTASARKVIKEKERCHQKLFDDKMKAEQIKQEARVAEKETRSAIDKLTRDS